MKFIKFSNYTILKSIILIAILCAFFIFLLGWIFYGQVTLIIALGTTTVLLVGVQIETYHRLSAIWKERKRIEEALTISNKIPALFNKTYMNDIIIKNDSFANTHGAETNFFGLGILYYGFVYILRAKVAVCLGSGSGFVPRALRQAQRDLGMIDSSKTILIDGNLPEAGGGGPDYLHAHSFLRVVYPDIDIWVKKTVDVAKQLESDHIKIDYLHIDAGKSYEDTLNDFKMYLPLMSEQFIITIHDTNDYEEVKRAVEEIRKMNDIELIDFNDLWSGLAIIKRKSCLRENKEN